MKKSTKTLARIFCLLLSVCCVLASAPITNAEGLLQLIIDDNVYNKVVLDAGSLALSHWKFDVSDDTLTLENFGTSSNPKGRIFAFPYGEALTINLIGENYIRVDDAAPLLVVGDITFTGTGRLTIYSNSMYGISTDYSVSVTESASLRIDGMAGIMALQGFSANTTGSVVINATRKAIMAQNGVQIDGGTVSLRGTNGLYTSNGNVLIRGGDTFVEITASSSAIFLANEENYVEWSANGIVRAGDTSPGSAITAYTNERYFRAAFSGLPKLNAPRRVYWDETEFSDGERNPVGRWTAVEQAIGYEVRLYYLNQSTNYYILKDAAFVDNGLSYNFDSMFTDYGQYFFTVRALGDDVNVLSSNESPKSATSYRYTGAVASRFYVSLPTSPYYTIYPLNESNVVYYGDNYCFTIEMDPAYSQTKPIIRCNGVRVLYRHDCYMIENVQSNLVITVDDPSLNQYRINIPTSEAYVIRPLKGYSDTVEHGGKFVFSFDIDELYRSKSEPVLYANGVELEEPLYGLIYTIDNITEDQTITVTGMIRDNYDVSFCQTDGTLLTTVNVDHGYPVARPADPVGPEGTVFLGWFNKDGTPYDFTSPVTGHISVYARYEAPKDENGVYLIATLAQLNWFREEVKFGNSTINGRLVADISMNSGKYTQVGSDTIFAGDAELWSPIGGYDYLAEGENYVRFYGGTFDGNGHTLSGFYIKQDAMDANASYLGIFGITSASAQIKDLTVVSSYFDGYSYVGAIVGKNEGFIVNCDGAATCCGVLNVGGIAGGTGGPVSGCVNNGTVRVDQYTSDTSIAPIGGNNGGGVIGIIDGAGVTVSDCRNNGEVWAYDCAGGIVGVCRQNGCAVSGCVNSGSVSSETHAGGLGAELYAQMTDCRSTGEVAGRVSAAGLTAVCAPGQILRCCNEGAISSRSGSAAGLVAALADFGSVSFRYCFNAGTVSAHTFAGGLAVELLDTVFYQCHSYGAISGRTTDAIIVQALSISASETYYVAEKFRFVSCGAAIPDTRFFSGWLAYDMNRSCQSSVWAQGSGYPILADASHPAFQAGFSGTGDYDAPYLINNERDLRLFSDLVDLESGYDQVYYRQTADITLRNAGSANNFIAIGTEQKPFMGVYDGGGYTLSGIHIQTGDDNVGLFGCADSASFLNIHLEDCSVSGENSVGMLIGAAVLCNIENCRVENASVYGVQNAGGLVGRSIGDISDSIVACDVSGTLSVGGLVGTNEDGTIFGCFTNGSVTAADSGEFEASEAGGLVGNNFGSIDCCGSTSRVVGGELVGGLCGVNYGSVSNAYASGFVTADGVYGGLLADDQGYEETANCYYNINNGGVVIGTAQQPYWFLSGVTAYHLNHDGAEPVWSQGDFGPVVAADSADAIRHLIRFVFFSEDYYFAGAPDGGSPAVMPEAPHIDNFAFLRWDAPLDAVTDNITTYAVFEQNSFINLVPTATVTIINIGDESILVGIDPNAHLTVGELRAQIANENIDITDEFGIPVLDPDTPVVSGMLIQLYSEPSVYEDYVTAVVFGDLDSNNTVDELDAFLLNMILNGVIMPEDLGVGARFAADLDQDGAITQNDMELFQKHLLNEHQITQRP